MCFVNNDKLRRLLAPEGKASHGKARLLSGRSLVMESRQSKVLDVMTALTFS